MASKIFVMIVMVNIGLILSEIAAAPTTPEERECTPGETHFDGCNTCICNFDGLFSCTMKNCEIYDPDTNVMIQVEVPLPADF